MFYSSTIPISYFHTYIMIWYPKIQYPIKWYNFASTHMKHYCIALFFWFCAILKDMIWYIVHHCITSFNANTSFIWILYHKIYYCCVLFVWYDMIRRCAHILILYHGLIINWYNLIFYHVNNILLPQMIQCQHDQCFVWFRILLYKYELKLHLHFHVSYNKKYHIHIIR